MMIDCDEMLGASILIVDDQEANELLEHIPGEAGYRCASLTMGPQTG